LHDSSAVVEELIDSYLGSMGRSFSERRSRLFQAIFRGELQIIQKFPFRLVLFFPVLQVSQRKTIPPHIRTTPRAWTVPAGARGNRKLKPVFLALQIPCGFDPPVMIAAALNAVDPACDRFVLVGGFQYLSFIRPHESHLFSFS
jgi:hypothetical protein